MRSVATAWIGETLSGHGAAICYECGWTVTDRLYGTVVLAAMAHEERHPESADAASEERP